MRTFDASNYFQGSEALWKAIPAAWCRIIETLPEKTKFGNRWYSLQHVSSASWYYISEDGRYLIRISTHWSKCDGGSKKITRCGWVSSCLWYLTHANKVHTRFGDVCGGIVAFDGMTESMSEEAYMQMRQARYAYY